MILKNEDCDSFINKKDGCLYKRQPSFCKCEFSLRLYSKREIWLLYSVNGKCVVVKRFYMSEKIE